VSLNLPSEKMIEVRYLDSAEDTYHDTIEEDLATIGYQVIHSSEAWQSNGMYVVLAAIKGGLE
jgi:hypothetical protein